MSEINVFKNNEFGEVRTVVINGNIWFVGNDIAKALGYSDCAKAVRTHCKGVDEMAIPSNGGNQKMRVISESDVYRLIIRSKLPSAEKFSDWVFEEVLPSIRKNGGYIKNQENLTPEQIVANALIVANNIIKEKDAQIAELSPKGQYFDSLVESKLLTTFRDCAKEFNIPPKTFTNWLTENGYIYRDRHNIIKPYEQHRKSGLFQMKDFLTPNGYSNVQTYITVKGKETFRLLLHISEVELPIAE